MAAKRVDHLEKRFDKFQDNITKHISQLAYLITKSHWEEPSVNAHIGESNHHIHFNGNHHHSNHRTPKMDMYKLDGSNPAVWVAQMEQYFSLNDICEDGTKLHVGALYLDQERC